MNVEVQQEKANPSIGNEIRFHNFGRANTHHGYDVRFQIGANHSPEAFTIGGGYLPDPETSEDMFMKLETGEGKFFANLPYQVKILDSELFYCEADAVGNKTWRAKVYIAGHHDGFGKRNERPWTEAEQVAFVSVSITPWVPGEIIAKLIPSGRQHEDAELHYRKVKRNDGMHKKVQNIRLQVFKLREERVRENSEVDGEKIQVVLFDQKAHNFSNESSLATLSDK